MSWIVIFAVFEIFYAYVGYPVCLSLLLALGFRRNQTVSQGFAPRLTLIITARNEAKVIQGKLENTLALTVPRSSAVIQSIQILVASDGSDDGTDEIVKGFLSRGVKLVRLEPRGGKECAQKKALESATGDIIVFTDAKICLESSALEQFVERFQDPKVGAVSSVDEIIGEEGGEGAYVRYEMWLRSLESKFSSVIGLSGSCFAVRREVAQDLRTDIPSDFALLLAAKARGYVGVHAPEIVGRYEAVPTHEAEFRRKVRTVLRGITTLFACREVMNVFEYGSFAWQIISHKLCRWLVPFCFIGACLGCFLEFSPAMILLQLCFAIFLALAGIGAFHPEYKGKWFCKLPLFFLVVNAGILVAWYYFLTGKRFVSWSPSEKGSTVRS